MFTMDANRLAGFPLAAAKNGPSGALVFADFADVYISTWGVLEIAVDPFTGFRNGLISMRAFLRADVLVAHASAIAIRTSVS
jgi:Phage capsid family